MKIVKEDFEIKEPLPGDYLANLISRHWENLGEIKGEIEAIKGYAGAEEVINALQALGDAYYVCVGQLEAHVQHVGLQPTPVATTPIIQPVPEVAEEKPEVKVELAVPPEFETAVDCANPVHPEPEHIETEPFEYFVDFDNPTPDADADAEIEKAKKQLKGQTIPADDYEIIEF